MTHDPHADRIARRLLEMALAPVKRRPMLGIDAEVAPLLLSVEGRLLVRIVQPGDPDYERATPVRLANDGEPAVVVEE